MFGYFSIAGFILFFAIASWLWAVPAWVGVFYVALSTACFVLHALDKRAAIRGSWRIPEKALLGIGLAGGWPGAILSQRIFRHKTAKPSFQRRFWLGVALNVAIFLSIWTPIGQALNGL